MTASICSYPGDRDEALIAALYDDGDPVKLSAFEAHMAGCQSCRDEIDTLRGVRAQLSRWAPPEPSFGVIGRQPQVVSPESTAGNQPSTVPQGSAWRQVPVWAQVAAALLFLGVSAGIANIDIRYDASGLSVRTGWLTPASDRRVAAAGQVAPSATVVPAAAPAPVDPAPWRADLAALEQQMKSEMHASLAAAPRAVSASDADLIRRVRALVDESEKRQQTELALRVAEVLRDVSSQRQADLVKIDRSLGAVQNNLGVEVMKQRQSLNLLYRASQKQ
jgi:hypothetical protein